MISKTRATILAVLGMAALPAAATECGVANHGFFAPFAGHWRDEVGDVYDIAPGKITQTFTVHTAKGDERHKWTPRLVITDDEQNPDNSLLDCREMTVAERDSINEVMTGLAAKQQTERVADADYISHETISLFRTYLAAPPYPMMAATHNGDEQWLVLLKKPDRLVDVFYDGANRFTVHVYEKTAAK
jgi:hypothetical protein